MAIGLMASGRAGLARAPVASGGAPGVAGVEVAATWFGRGTSRKAVRSPPTWIKGACCQIEQGGRRRPWRRRAMAVARRDGATTTTKARRLRETISVHNKICVLNKIYAPNMMRVLSKIDVIQLREE